MTHEQRMELIATSAVNLLGVYVGAYITVNAPELTEEPAREALALSRDILKSLASALEDNYERN